MTQDWVDDAKHSQESSTSSSSSDLQNSLHGRLRPRNVFRLLALRETSPYTKNSSKKFWHHASSALTEGFDPTCEIIDARQALMSWVEADSLKKISAKNCHLLPYPKSTIAAAFSPDGKTIASTHGDHTVKIIDFRTGICLKVLNGHNRTPWVVRFHPLNSDIIASGSLDQEVRLWDTNTTDCITSHIFHRQINSISFHAQGDILAIAAGRKLFMWQYSNMSGESLIPTIVLDARRTLRAVQFHPYAAPLLFTAEIDNLVVPDFSSTIETTSGDNDLTNPVERSMEPSIPNVTERNNATNYSDSSISILASWRLPFSQGWVKGQTHAGPPIVITNDSAPQAHAIAPTISAPITNHGNSWSRNRRSDLMAPMKENASQMPYTVKLRIWEYDIQAPFSPLELERCLLAIPHVVLCSEMGAHFSPCGRFLVACIACVLPRVETTSVSVGPATSPTRHPALAHHILYELRIYSIEEATFGAVLASREITAGHCLTSIQFSPTSEHLILAYGRRHDSLLRKNATDESGMHTYTTLEVYRVSDMELVRVLPSAEDEVNVVCFHPLAGGGLAYGTKEGMVRFFHYGGPCEKNCTGSSSLSELS